MTIVHTVNEWKEMIYPAVESKVEEFRLMGYSKATADDIWNCLVQKVWKDNPDKRLYEVVQDVFHLGATTYMSYLTVKAYQNDDLMASIAAVTGGNMEGVQE